MANSVNRYFEGLLVGGTLGFVFGLLSAQKPGSELRREIADSADELMRQANIDLTDLKDKVNEKVAPLADKASNLKEQAEYKFGEFKDQAGSKFGEIKEQANSKFGELKDRAGDLKEKAGELRDKAVELKSDLREKISGPDGAELLNNYMGNNSGPMYTAGHKVSPDGTAMPVSDSCSNYSAGKAGEGAAGG